MSKFKVGDRVAVSKPWRKKNCPYLGIGATVLKVVDEGECEIELDIKIENWDNGITHVTVDGLEFEAIYNSPLWKALKE